MIESSNSPGSGFNGKLFQVLRMIIPRLREYKTEKSKKKVFKKGKHFRF